MSAQWESQELLQPIAADLPCGENLEDTALLASFDAFRLFGQSTPLDPSPEWGEIRTRALEALGRSKDLRLLAHLGAALLRTEGLVAFSGTLCVASHWLETYWAGSYPLVDEDALLRRNALNCFADPMAVIDGLRRLPLVASRQHGTFSLRDIDIATGQMPSPDGESRPDERRIDAAFAEMPLEQLHELQRSAAEGIDALKRIEALMSAEGGPEMVPEFDPLAVQLGRIDRVLRARYAARTGTVAGEDAVEAGLGGNGQPAGAVGPIKSRNDAIRALDAVAEFFRHNEPSSPVPLLIDRAKRLVAKSFLEVLADIAPEAVAQARSAGGLSQDMAGE
jgi:type VI secretion system protein ImpA